MSEHMVFVRGYFEPAGPLAANTAARQAPRKAPPACPGCPRCRPTVANVEPRPNPKPEPFSEARARSRYEHCRAKAETAQNETSRRRWLELAEFEWKDLERYRAETNHLAALRLDRTFVATPILNGKPGESVFDGRDEK